MANKVDLRYKRVVSTEEAQAFAVQNDLGYVEVSALDSFYISEAFDALIDSLRVLLELLLAVYEKNQNNQTKQVVPVDSCKNPTMEKTQAIILPRYMVTSTNSVPGIAVGSAAAAMMTDHSSSGIVRLTKVAQEAGSKRCKC